MLQIMIRCIMSLIQYNLLYETIKSIKWQMKLVFVIVCVANKLVKVAKWNCHHSNYRSLQKFLYQRHNKKFKLFKWKFLLLLLMLIFANVES